MSWRRSSGGEGTVDKKGYETGSRNVFEDIGIPNDEEHRIKAQLVFNINTILKDRGLKQVEAADLFGICQPDVSRMLHGGVPAVFRGTTSEVSSCARL